MIHFLSDGAFSNYLWRKLFTAATAVNSLRFNLYVTPRVQFCPQLLSSFVVSNLARLTYHKL